MTTEAPEFIPEPPTESGSPFYACEWCCAGFTGPITKELVCPRCGRSGDGVYRVDQEWVERRFRELKEVEQVRQKAAEDGLTNPDVLMQRVFEVRKRYYQGDLGRMAKDTATKEQPKAEKKVKTKSPCACGCGTETGGTWAPGHDAKFFSSVKKVQNGKMTNKELAEMYPANTIKEFSGRVH